MITQITALPIANASLLDEGTAASEAMLMLFRKNKSEKTQFLVDKACFQQTIDVIISRAEPLDIEIIVTDFNSFDFSNAFGCIIQYPNRYGHISTEEDYKNIVSKAHESSCKVIFASDLMCLQLFEAPGNLGADISVGNSQRFGVPSDMVALMLHSCPPVKNLKGISLVELLAYHKTEKVIKHID